MSPRAGQRCAKELPQLQKALRELKAKDSFSVFQARVVNKIATPPAPPVRERPCIETLQHLSNSESWTPETQRAQGGGKQSRRSIAPCTKSPSSRGGARGERHDGLGNQAVLGADISTSIAKTHSTLLGNPNETQNVSLFCADQPPSLALASFPPCGQTEGVASAEPHYRQLNMPMSPSAAHPPYPSEAGGPLWTPASRARQSKSSLAVRPSRRRYRNLDGPLDRRFRLEGDSLSAGAQEIVQSHRANIPTSHDASMVSARRMSQYSLPMKSSPEPTAAAAIPFKQTEELEANGMFTCPSPVRPDLSAIASAGLLLTDDSYAHDGRPWAVAGHHAILCDHTTEPPISSYSALADALLMSEGGVQA
ncbi:hypothetical protein BD414DRAFT_488907 [Trametes punicea]|nr:hypothetical protein BD414DRAFT_488907 [Trametes punicea]